MVIEELKLAYEEFKNISKKDEINGKRIIELLLKIQDLELKLTYEMFYEEIILNIIDEEIDDIVADIYGKFNVDILSEPLIKEISRSDYVLLTKLKNKLNTNLDKFWINNDLNLEQLCYFVNKNYNNKYDNKYWLLKKFLNERFDFIEVKHEKTKVSKYRRRNGKNQNVVR